MGFFYVLAIIKNGATNIGVHIPNTIFLKSIGLGTSLVWSYLQWKSPPQKDSGGGGLECNKVIK